MTGVGFVSKTVLRLGPFSDICAGDEEAAVLHRIEREIEELAIQFANGRAAFRALAQLVTKRAPVALDVAQPEGNVVFNAGLQNVAPRRARRKHIGDRVELAAEVLIAEDQPFLGIIDCETLGETVEGVDQKTCEVLIGNRVHFHGTDAIPVMFQSFFQSPMFCFNCNSARAKFWRLAPITI